MVWNPFRKRGRARSTAAAERAVGERPTVAPAVGEHPAPQRPDRVGDTDARAVADIERDVVDVLRTIFDPEIPIDIYELGLIYELHVAEGGDVHIRMTLTSPACPVAGSLPPEVEERVGGVQGVRSVTVEVTWEPPWSPDRMSEAARLQLGL